MAVEIDSIPDSKAIGWADARLARDAANTLAQRNGANAQAFNLYNTYTDASNYERLGVRWSSNVVQLGPQRAGTGAARTMEIVGATGQDVKLVVTNASGAVCGFFTDTNVQLITARGNGQISILGSTLTISSLPTSDPAVAGRVWNDSGTLKISAG